MHHNPNLETIWQEWLDDHHNDLQHYSLDSLKNTLTPCLQIFVTKPDTIALFNFGLHIASELLTCHNDLETLLAAILSPYLPSATTAEKSHLQKIVPTGTYKLLSQLTAMRLIDSHYQLQSNFQSTGTKNDKLRRLILTMAQDVRAILLKLCEQLATLKNIRDPSDKKNKETAQRILEVYAPLANRLGIGQLKWQLEDFSLRCLQPEQYHSIAKALQMRRPEREQHLLLLQEKMKDTLQQADIQRFEISSRAKHITSIMHKLQKKNLTMEQLYDALAIRILTDSIPDCYKALGAIHSRWAYLASEFDDYVAHPKNNGYQSIHTIIQTMDLRAVEVQIRTFDMHQAAELGVASHWRYKEESNQTTTNHAQKIDLLRQILQWQQSNLTTPTLPSTIADPNQPPPPMSITNVFEDYLYIFTPQGDLIDLPQGATPLDFAYRIHTDVGHRCKGAKVNGHLVPLTHTLQNGDCVSILTQKNGTPSRDWLIPQQNYLTTNRARQKVAHWFKSQNEGVQLQAGLALWDKHIRPLNPSKEILNQTCLSLNLSPKKRDLLIALGSGHIGINTVLNRLQPPTSVDKPATLLEQSDHLQKKIQSAQTNPTAATLSHEGLLMQPARCCQPIPGDQIIGYITHGRGISLHRPLCKNLQALQVKNPQRGMPYTWPSITQTKHYPATLTLLTENRDGMMRDISGVIVDHNWSIQHINSQLSRDNLKAKIMITILIDHTRSLQKLTGQLKQLPGIIDIYRQR